MHVRQIRTDLEQKYEDLIDPKLDDDQNLSRLLARHGVELELDASSDRDSIEIEITDGAKDRGIDAIAVDSNTNTVTLVQSKWRNDGRGSVDLAGVLKFVRGVKGVLDIEDGVLPECSPELSASIRDVTSTPGGHVRLVLISTASDELSDDVQEPVAELLSLLNDVGEENEIASFTFYRQSDVFRQMFKPPSASIDAELQLLNWGKQAEPTLAFYGRASGLQIAEWFSNYGVPLFAENIRVVLPNSEINDGIYRTIQEEPENFWYYNNGITLLCDKIEWAPAGLASNEAAQIRVCGASVVNGAQTVSTLGRALAAGLGEQLARVFVNIRCIQVGGHDNSLGSRITRFANTQNVVSPQDFVFLDAEQHRLVQELRSLDVEYLLRSGERPTMAGAVLTFDVRRAAVALACLDSVANAVLAKREVSRLYDRESGPYRSFFNKSVEGVLVERAVRVVDEVDRVLDVAAEQTSGVRAGVAVHGRRVIAHLVMNSAGRKSLGDAEFDFETWLKGVEPLALEFLDRFEKNFPGGYPGNVFKNRARCDALVAALHAGDVKAS
ncbi:AIPR protein [Cellulosimicrobium cellulans]|nr:AIPR protein [Cellulosimicrobium cellulans]